MRKFILNYLQYLLSRLIAGRKNYELWKKENYSLKTAKIKNKKLAKELEDECSQKEGFLTFAEYLQIDQFGKNGYHANHALHGETNAHKHWVKAVVCLCLEKDFNQIVEFGPGEGKLALEVIKLAKKKGKKIIWSGIEINENLKARIKQNFQKENLKDNLKEIVSDSSKLALDQKCLFIFSYSLDSVPPEIFINLEEEKTFPNALLGITVKDQILTEIVLNKDLLKRKNLFLENGIFKKTDGNLFDLSMWQLFPNQRAYLPVNSFSAFIEFANKASRDSLFLIIDEFLESALPWETNHLCLPKNLLLHQRICQNLKKAYEESGENLLYYPTYYYTFFKFLNSLGFQSIQAEIEQKMAKEITKERWFALKIFYRTYSFLASKKTKNEQEIIKLQFPQFKLM